MRGKQLGLGLALIFAIWLPIFGFATPLCEVELTVPFKSGRGARGEWLKKFSLGARDHAQVDAVARQILSRSDVEVEKWIQLIVDNYHEIARGRAGPPLYAIIGGKRVADRLLFWLQRHNEKFANYSSALGPQNAFRKILEEQVQLFQSECSADEIFQIVVGFQKALSDWRKNNPSGASPSVVVGGSFINGKIRPGSDVDVSFSDVSVGRLILGELKAVVHSLRGSKCNPEVEAHGEGEMFYGRLNPYALKIWEDHLELFVFKPRTHQSPDLFPPVSEYKSYFFGR